MKVLLTILAIASIVSIQPAQAQVQKPADEQPAITAAAERFTTVCAACHGTNATGGQGPSLVGDKLQHGADRESLARSIRDGYADRGMPAFQGMMTEAEIQQMVSFLQEKRTAAQGTNKTVSPEAADSVNAPRGIVHTDVADFTVETVASVGPAFGFALLPDNTILISEIGGALRWVGKDRNAPHRTIQGTPVPGESKEHYHRLMMDVSLHPDYRHNGWVYVLTAANNVAQPEHGVSVTVNRGRIRDGRWVENQRLFTFPTEFSSSARIAWDRQNCLYVATTYSGYHWSGTSEDSPPQNPNEPLGKILRLTDEGKVPADNPFVDRPGAYPYVWSYGHRSTLGLAFDRNGELWESENGARGGDEINHIRRGRNYGWPVITWGHIYENKLELARPEAVGMEQPVVSFVPSPALGGLAVYTGNAFPKWKDNLIVGSLKRRELYRIVVDGDREVLRESLLHDFGRIRDIDTGPDGLIYILTDDSTLLRLRPAKAAPH